MSGYYFEVINSINFDNVGVPIVDYFKTKNYSMLLHSSDILFYFILFYFYATQGFKIYSYLNPSALNPSALNPSILHNKLIHDIA
jgi:hypothetical protein